MWHGFSLESKICCFSDEDKWSFMDQSFLEEFTIVFSRPISVISLLRNSFYDGGHLVMYLVFLWSPVIHFHTRRSVTQGCSCREIVHKSTEIWSLLIPSRYLIQRRQRQDDERQEYTGYSVCLEEITSWGTFGGDANSVYYWLWHLSQHIIAGRITSNRSSIRHTVISIDGSYRRIPCSWIKSTDNESLRPIIPCHRKQ